MSASEMITAWQAWEDRVGDVSAAGHLEDVVQREATELGFTGSALRVAVTNERLRGGSLVRACLSVYKQRSPESGRLQGSGLRADLHAESDPDTGDGDL